MRSRDKAFTFTDLVVVLVLIAFLFVLIINRAHRLGDVAQPIECGENLRMIGNWILLYANENKGNYPRTVLDPSALDKLTQYSGVAGANPFGPGGLAPNDTTAALFLLVRVYGVQPKVFVCPESGYEPWDFGGKTGLQVSNFPGEQYLSYSYIDPYVPPPPYDSDHEYNVNSVRGGDEPVAADMNPGSAELLKVTPNSPLGQMAKANSRNHKGAGQNVLAGDCHVEWVSAPYLRGRFAADNFYTAGPKNGPSSRITGPRDWGGDSILLPVATLDPPGVSVVGRTLKGFIATGGPVLAALGVAALLITLFVCISRIRSTRRVDRARS